MPKYKFDITPDGGKTISEEHNLDNLADAVEKFKELSNLHCPKPIMDAYRVTTSKPCSFQVWVFNDSTKRWDKEPNVF